MSPDTTHALLRPARLRLAALALACLGLALPTAANAASGSGSGGAGFGGTTSTSTTSTTPTTTTTSGSSTSAQATTVGGPVSASGNGITLATSSVGLERRDLRLTGTVASSDTGDELLIERELSSGAWRQVASSTVASGGTFSVRWRANTSGPVFLRAALAPPSTRAAAASSTPGTISPALAVTIYRPAIATIYGPGFYGHRTACGQRLGRGTVGVASRTLPCGTQVDVVYRGRSVTVPVIDRGPFANGASWDLTEATARILGDPGTATVGTVTMPATAQSDAARRSAHRR